MYRITYEDADLWEPGVKDIISPQIEVELNTAGRLSFTLPPGHPAYFDIQLLRGTVVVYEGSEIIWFGRAVSMTRDVKNMKAVYCEGALAYLNDTIQRPRAAATVTPTALFTDILAVHNAQAHSSRQFTAGALNLPSGSILWKNDYETSLTALKRFLGYFQGYAMPRLSSGVAYLDCTQELPLDTGQILEYGQNLTKFTREYSFARRITALMPIGGTAPGASAPTTIAPVNDGDDILDTDLVSTYGRIVKNITYNEITDPGALKAVAEQYLEEYAETPITVGAGAVDLSYIDPQQGPFRVGNKYFVHSVINDLQTYLPLTKQTIRLDSALRQIEMQSPIDTTNQVVPKLTVRFVAGQTVLGSASYYYPEGYNYNIPLEKITVEGNTYQPPQESLTGTMPGADTVVDVAYTKAPDFAFVANGELYLGAKGTNISIDWGDGTTASAGNYNTDYAYKVHTFPSSSTEYIVKLYGNITDITFFKYDGTKNTSLRRIITKFPATMSEKTSFRRCFYWCTNLTSIPEGLFDNTTEAVDFSYCFENCRSLASIPEGLFDNTTEAVDFSYCFEDCRSLTSIHEGLFDNTTAAVDFTNCFSNCIALASIPGGLFANNTAATTFHGCFSQCLALSSIPEELFANNTAATIFSGCFMLCSGLTSIPAGLFDNTAIEYINQCFWGCTGITIAVPELWNKFPNVYKTDCFYGCTNAANYADIPSSWK